MAKLTGTVVEVHPFHAFALVEHGDNSYRYFLYSTAFSPIGRWSWADVTEGTTVRFTPIVHPKGDRGIEVEILDPG